MIVNIYDSATGGSIGGKRMTVELGPTTRQRVQHSVEVLADEFAGIFSRETIDAYFEESLDRFADATVEDFVPLMVERFARQRLRALAQAEGKVTKEVPEVLFVCVHNSGRSQMAAGLLDKLAEGRVHVRSAGSDPADQLNPNAVAAMEEVGVDISQEFPKPLTDEVVRAADAVITMGCGDACPIYPGKRYEDWDLEDPAGKDLETVRRIRDEIRGRVEALIATLAENRAKEAAG
jgi:arsenate reductase (thioredoxin)